MLDIEQERNGARQRVDTAHLCRDHLADAVCKIFINRVALGLADALEDDLLGSLRGDTSEIIGRIGHADDIAEFGGRRQFLGITLGNLGMLVEHLVDDLALGQHAHFAADAIDFGRHIGNRPIVALVGRYKGRLNGLKNDLAVQPLVRRHLVDTGYQCFRHTPTCLPQPWLGMEFPLTTTKVGVAHFCQHRSTPQRHRSQQPPSYSSLVAIIAQRICECKFPGM